MATLGAGAPTRSSAVSEGGAPDSGSTARFVINLTSARSPIDPAQMADMADASHHLYVARYNQDGITWHRLRLGFFATEAETRRRLAAVRVELPDAWLDRASEEERAEAVGASASPHREPVRAPSTREVTPSEAAVPFAETAVSRRSSGPSESEGGAYVITLESRSSPFAPADLPDGRRFAPQRLYTTRITKDGRVWHRLRLGPFPTEAETRRRLDLVRVEFPGAWLDRAHDVDVEAASPETSASSGAAGLALNGTAPSLEGAEEMVSEAPSSAAPELATGPVMIDDPQQVLLYSVSVNRQDFGVTTIIRTPDGRVLIRGADLDVFGLIRPPGPVALFRGEEYYDPAELPGFELSIDESRLVVALQFLPEAFEKRVVGGPGSLPEPSPPGVGGFANYDLFATHFDGRDADQTHMDGLFEAGVFVPWGTGVTGFLGRNLIARGGEGGSARLIRLDSTWTKDWPERVVRLELGDSVGRSGIWGRPVRFGGVQWGKNFDTRPTFLTFPLPGVSGEAILPSTAELYIDGALLHSQRVSPGPFDIVELPVLTGGGEAELVIRDLLGREQVVSVPFYTSNALLREGLTDYGIEAGFIRENFGIESNDYGRFLTVATASAGLSDSLTVEGRMELLEDQRTAGVGASFVLPFPLLVTSAVAMSDSARGYGHLLFVGLERRRARGMTFAARVQYATRRFTQLGLAPGRPAPRLLGSTSLGLGRVGLGSLSFAYAFEDRREGVRRELVSAFYSLPLAREATISAYATKSLVEPHELAFGVNYVHRLGDRETASVSYDANDDSELGSLQLQRSLPAGEGLGYRLEFDGFGEVARQEAEGAWRSPIGTYRVGASRVGATRTYRASADGGVAFQAGTAKLMRPVEDSFATVRVGEYSDVGVYLNNQLVARTDEEGFAWLPGLLDYQNNLVRLEVLDLPLDANIGADELKVVPYFRSGVHVEFPVEPSGGALVRLVLADGEPLPVGAFVKVEGREERFPVARHGEAYVTGLETTNRLRAFWRDRSCGFDLELPPDAGPIPRLGPILCEGVER